MSFSNTLLSALALVLLGTGCEPAEAGLQPGETVVTDTVEGTTRRMPAEWEPQAAIWLQWPQSWEGRGVEAAFVDIVANLVDFEDVHLIVHDGATHDQALSALGGVDLARVTFHEWATDSSWMRDNGPRYVEVDGQLVLQNWEFDAWGSADGWGGFGNQPYDLDNVIPDYVGAELGVPIEQVSLIHERGDLEVNGRDTALVNWSVVSDRNPQLTQAEATAAFQESLGVSSVIYAEGFHPLDGTRGHVDGMARFVAEDTILVGDDGSRLMDDVAEQIAEQRPDLTVDRLEARDAALFLNFLVGDGFVLMGTSGDSAEDAKAAAIVGSYFPGREVRFADIDALWRNGGGIHCVTNDQPE